MSHLRRRSESVSAAVGTSVRSDSCCLPERPPVPGRCRHTLRRAARAASSAVVAVLVTAVTLMLPAAPAGAVSNLSEIEVTRYGGADRYATSLRIAEAFADGAGGRLEQVVLVSGQQWTDAVVAAPLAGALEAPVLTTPSSELRSDAAAFLRRTGVSDALIVGADSDTDGVGPSVVTELEALGISVERVTRPDQYATSVAAARRAREREAARERVPVELAMKANMIGTPEMVAERLRVYRDAGITTLRLGLAGANAEEKLDTLGLTMDLVRGMESSD